MYRGPGNNRSIKGTASEKNASDHKSPFVRKSLNWTNHAPAATSVANASVPLRMGGLVKRSTRRCSRASVSSLMINFTAAHVVEMSRSVRRENDVSPMLMMPVMSAGNSTSPWGAI